jgi:hypothetical protein
MTNDLVDTESRLRSYLQARAQSYPEASVPPGLPGDPGSRRRWPVLLAAAAVIAVLAATVSTVRLLDRGDPATTGGTGPTMPYVLVAEDSATLHDGDTAVRLEERTSHFVLGRVADGWVVRKMVKRDQPPPAGGLPVGVDQIGIVDRSGRFTPVGPQEVLDAVVSPDHTQVAIVSRVAGNSARMAVFDLAAKKEVASVPVHASVSTAAWNRHGIWIHQTAVTHPVDVYVWRPGQPQPQRVGGVTSDGLVVAAGTTDRIIVQGSRGTGWCLRVLEPRTTTPMTMTTVREHCASGRQPYPVLSPDGRTMVLPDDRLAIEIDSGKQSSVDIPSGERSATGAYPETATSFLVVTAQPAGSSPTLSAVTIGPGLEALSFPVPASVVSRCVLSSGSCSPILRVPAGTILHLRANS